MLQPIEVKRVNKLAALLFLAFLLFLLNKKLFFTLLLLSIGFFFLYTFGRNVHAKHPKVVTFGIVLGIIFFIAALLYWIM